MGFNVCLVRWPGPVPYFEAYREIAETVWHGLRRLGHDAILSDNRIAADRRNIVLGFHALAPKELPQLPESTILYQLEQVVQGELKPVFHAIGDQFTVWDYSVRNMERLRPIGGHRARQPRSDRRCCCARPDVWRCGEPPWNAGSRRPR